MEVSKKVVVTGAASGIGKAVALRFASEGWLVCALDVNEVGLGSLAREWTPGEHLTLVGDYSQPSTAESLERLLATRWPGIDALVNCAGKFETGDPVSTPLETWRRPLDLHLDGAFAMTRVCVPRMPAGGRIIHITSIHGERAERGGSAYAVSKAALNQYCRSLAVDLAGKGLLVNAIAPGFVATPMSVVNGIDELNSPWFQNNYVEGHHLPLRRAGRPEEIASVAWFLAGPDASYLTGQVITVDGGLSITF